ncbi:MAG: cytochrome c [Pseudomonadota bacterium]
MKNKILAISVLIVVGINPAIAERDQGPGLGIPVTDDLLKQWDTSIFPDGEGLPMGSGHVTDGEEIYNTQCVSCHAPGGIGSALGDQLAGAQMSLTSDFPEQTIGSYWPYATTLFDIIRRSMPMTAPGSLSDDEVYAVTAYLLYLNNLIDKDQVINQETLPDVKMPNENGFINIYETERIKE